MTQAFWPSCGYELLAHSADGQLLVSDDFLRFLLNRPELALVDESCPAERALQASLMQEPRRTVSEGELAKMADDDVIDNYRMWLHFRTRLLAHPTLEASYLAMYAAVDVPPVLLEGLTQLLLRHMLRDARSALQLRVAEMLFRPQRIAISDDGTVLAADQAVVSALERRHGFGSVGKLLQQAGMAVRGQSLRVLRDDNAAAYGLESERFDWVVAINHGQPAAQALCEVLRLWVAHLLGLAVRIHSEREIVDRHWSWHVGLDAQASSLLNDLYQGQLVQAERHKRLLGLFRLEFVHPEQMAEHVRGKPVYLAMAMDAEGRLTLKPQNLLLNLPLAT
jgi:hypothetical protein